MKNSFVELNARERVNALLDNGRELIDPFDQIIAPSLPAQGIVPESDDGIVVSRGTINGKQAVVIAMEGKFQGGGIGEVSGAKIVAALEHVLEENKKGNEIFPVIVLDTGGVRLQEANYGLLSISEIGNVIIALKQYVPVIGLIPGRVGSFGGMSITSALMSYLIATKKARVGLNGPEVIEQEAGVREFDSSDKDLIWNTLGSRQRVESKIIDELVTDSVEAIKAAVIAAMDERKDTHRSESSAFYLSLLDSLDLSKPMAIDDYNEAIANHQAKHAVKQVIHPWDIIEQESYRQEKIMDYPVYQQFHAARNILSGCKWGIGGSLGFELSTGIPAVKETSDFDLLLYANSPIELPIQVIQSHPAFFEQFDTQVVTRQGGFSLKEYLREPEKKILLKTVEGPKLTKELW
ncbi:biotin-independent malonate decarboxylase subunit beta [Enterococcus faecium]|nr:biotin-independent malonate decarboxylase subunit beta [Enterococcus faecium]